jgi:hypothetical protein
MFALDLLDDLFEPDDTRQFQSWAPGVVADEFSSFISDSRPSPSVGIKSTWPFGGAALRRSTFNGDFRRNPARL